MATDVVIPDLGEGIEDVTISRWRVKEGDSVSEGDIVVEIATDKVDTEIVAPVAGTVLKLNGSEGEIVPLSHVLAVVGAEGESVESAPAADEASAAPEKAAAEEAATEEADPEAIAEISPEATAEDEPVSGEGKQPADDEGKQPADGDDTGVKASPVARRIAAEKGVALSDISGTGPGGRITKEDVLASSDKPAQPEADALPGDLADEAALAVRRLAAEHNLNLREIAGDKPLSALTRYDVLSAVASRDAGESVVVEPRFAPPADWSGAPAAAPEKAAPDKSAPAKATQDKSTPKPAAEKQADVAPAGGEELVKHSRMRAAVARSTSQSVDTTPHVTTMWDVEMSAVMAHRKANKSAFAQEGVNLTLTAYFFEAALAGLRAVPAANSSWTDEGVLVKYYYNMGMAVALPADKYGMGGLIVPVIKNAGELNLLGIARAVNELAEKARNNELRTEDITGGTFTISNYGTGGSRFQTPVIVQPQVGILGVGAIEKRAIVVSQGHPLEPNTGDYLSFRPMTTLGFSYDHRVLDGATADAFCAAVKEFLENYE